MVLGATKSVNIEDELRSFHELKGYLPQVVLVHMSPILEKEIKAEVEAVADNLDTTITFAHEGMQLQF